MLIKALSKWVFKIEHTANFLCLDKLVVDQLLVILSKVPFLIRKNLGLRLVSTPVGFSVLISFYRRHVCKCFLVRFSDHNFVLFLSLPLKFDPSNTQVVSRCYYFEYNSWSSSWCMLFIFISVAVVWLLSQQPSINGLKFCTYIE